ncbi:MAG: family 43 glycosylhydrolase [candidate division KSB1 bacterium]|nr:family 43 glycosylhydrolase [candidate division KSB1 bacterium]
MIRLSTILGFCLLTFNVGFGQSPSFSTFMNPIIPGDHPDPTLSRFGNHFYTTGSSFATTPIIYHSTDLVHWEAVSQPVSNSWPLFGTSPTDGIWGGHLVFYNNKYWHFFGHAGRMFFVTADKPEGPWSSPQEIACPPRVPGLGMDNSIFIDDDGSWYLLVKNGQVNNWIVQLGSNGQAAGAIYDLRWINPAPSYPFSWAEGPVMWKHKGYYYYSFAINIYATQRVMRSRILTGDQAAWEYLGNFFNEDDPLKGTSLYRLPNHCSPAIMLDDSTWWVISQSYGTSEWEGLGRQGLLSQVRYDATGKPVADFPINAPMAAPKLPSSGIPWMVPKSDFFNSDKLNPEWRLLGYCPVSPYSLTARPGWVRLSPKNQHNTIIKSDAEHNWSLITRLDFAPQTSADEAGLRVMTGLQTLYAKLYSSLNSEGKKVIRFSFDKTSYEAENTVGNVVWLRLYRVNHSLSGYFSADGHYWTQVGKAINVATMDVQQANYNALTGNRQGLYVIGKNSADFDLYIYRDAYTPIMAESPANQYGTSRGYTTPVYILDNIHVGDWAMYAGVEFGGNAEYDKTPDSLKVIASSATTGGTIEVWLDSLETGEKIGECSISNTGSWRTFKTFTSVVKPVSGRHDVYLKFSGTETGKLFQLQSFYFTAKGDATTAVTEPQGSRIPKRFDLEQNIPNPFGLLPFNPSTTIRYALPKPAHVTLTIYNVQGIKLRTLVDTFMESGEYKTVWNATDDHNHPVASGVYFYRLETGEMSLQKKMLLLH